MRKWYSITAKSDVSEIFIYDVIGEDWFGGISAKQFLEDLSAIKSDDISVRINSPGGDVFDGTAIYNGLIHHKAKITTHIDGVAASMASVIAMAGDTIKMAENSMLMIHNPYTLAIGDANELRKTADVLDKTKLSLLSSYTGQSNLSSDEISALMDDETWMTGAEALEKGFVDEVTSNVKLAALDKRAFANYKNVPDILMRQEVAEPQSRKNAIARLKLDLIV